MLGTQSDSNRLFVRAVAERCLAAAFAPAKINGSAFIGGVLDRGELTRSFMRAIAVRLILALPARAPPVVFASFDFHRERGIARANGIGHGVFLYC